MDSWYLTDSHFDPLACARQETLFAQANGIIGVRGAYEENRCSVDPSIFVNGFHEKEQIYYGERFPGYPENYQTITALPDGSVIELFVDGDPFDMSQGTLLNYYRHFDLRRGGVLRHVKWTAPSGVTVKLWILRIVSFIHFNWIAIRWRMVTDRAARVRVVSSISSYLRPASMQSSVAGDPRAAVKRFDNQLITDNPRLFASGGQLRYTTPDSVIDVICTMHNKWLYGKEVRDQLDIDNQNLSISHVFETSIGADKAIGLNKYVSYQRVPHITPKRALSTPAPPPFAMMFRGQHQYLNTFWDSADLIIDGDNEAQHLIRFSIFHLLQAAAALPKLNDPPVSIPAKGLTGDGYGGSYFWDSEIYMFPFFLYSAPKIARCLLEYRSDLLPLARNRAEELCLDGALYPWRTIDGEESSSYYPAGTAQYHINADIIYSVTRYIQITKDEFFLVQRAFEMYVETARMWISLGDFIEDKGFCFQMVTGPDEYTVMVNNNLYTNIMAQYNLQKAVEMVRWVEKHYPEEYASHVKTLSLREEEILQWGMCAEAIYIPYDTKRGIHAQDDNFFDRAPWKFDLNQDKHPLLLHYHPLTIYRYQILKQPDIVLAQILRSSQFTLEEKRRAFDYYDPITTNDSSLAPCTRSIMASELGYHQLAWDHFQNTLRLDTLDLNGNTGDGMHLAAIGGAWMTIVYGFCGLRDDTEILRFCPNLPKAWKRLRIKLTIQNATLVIEVLPKFTRYDWAGKELLTIRHWDTEVALHADSCHAIANRH